jgi:hypothetical protein
VLRVLAKLGPFELIIRWRPDLRLDDCSLDQLQSSVAISDRSRIARLPGRTQDGVDDVGRQRFGTPHEAPGEECERLFAIGAERIPQLAGDRGRGVGKRPGLGDGAGVTAGAAVSSGV